MVVLFAVTILPRLGNDPDTARTLGDKLWESGNAEGALDAYELAFADDPSDDFLFDRIIEGRMAKAKGLRNANKAKEAAELLQETLREANQLRANSKNLGQTNARQRPWVLGARLVVELIASEIASGQQISNEQSIERLNRTHPRGHNIFGFFSPRSNWLAREGHVERQIIQLFDDHNLLVRRWARQVLSGTGFSRFDLLSKFEPQHRGFFSVAGHFRNLHLRSDAFESHLDDALCEELAGLVRRREIPLSWIPSVCMHLAIAANLPDRFAHRQASDWTEPRVQSIVDAWEQLKALDHAGRRRLRLDRVGILGLNPTRLLDPWFRTLSACGPKIEDPYVWWSRHRDADPIIRWSDQLRVSPDANIEEILAAGDGVDSSQESAASNLIIWNRPAGAARAYGHKILSRWRQLLDLEGRRSDTFVYVKFGVFELAGGKIASQPSSEHYARLALKFDAHGNGVSQSFTTAPAINDSLGWVPPSSAEFRSDHDHATDSSGGFARSSLQTSTANRVDTAFSMPVVGFSPIRRTPGHSKLQLWARLMTRQGKLTLRVQKLDRQQDRNMSFTASQRRGIKIGTMTVLGDLGSNTRIRGGLERRVVLVFSSSDAIAKTSWSLKGWISRLSACIIAEHEESKGTTINPRRSVGSAQCEVISDLSRAACFLGVPKALSALNSWAKDFESPNGFFLKARENPAGWVVISPPHPIERVRFEYLRTAELMSGDRELISKLSAEQVRIYGHDAPFKNPEQFWLNIASNSPSDAARELAWQKLQHVHFRNPIRPALAAAYRAGAEIPGGLIDRFHLDQEHRPRLLWSQLATLLDFGFLFFVLYAMFLFSLFLMVLPRYRLLASAFLMLAGVGMACFHQYLEGVDYLPDTLGWALAAAASAYAARRCRNPWRYLAPAGFAAATVLAANTELRAFAIPYAWHAMGFAQLTAFAGLSIFAFRYQTGPDESRRLFGPFPARFLGIMAVVLVISELAFGALRTDVLLSSNIQTTIIAMTLLSAFFYTLMAFLDKQKSVIPLGITLTMLAPSAALLLFSALIQGQVSSFHSLTLDLAVGLLSVVIFINLLVIFICLIVKLWPARPKTRRRSLRGRSPRRAHGTA